MRLRFWRTSEPADRSTALRALPAACFFDLERWTDEPSTATRAVRFGGATGLG